MNLNGGRTPGGLTLTAGAMLLLSLAIGIVQFASALPLIFNGTSMSEGQEFSNDGGVTSGKNNVRKKDLNYKGWLLLVTES